MLLFAIVLFLLTCRLSLYGLTCNSNELVVLPESAYMVVLSRQRPTGPGRSDVAIRDRRLVPPYLEQSHVLSHLTVEKGKGRSP